jgi:hypothetical protein
MSKKRYSPELRRQVLKDLEEIKDPGLVAKKLNIPVHAVYRFKREELSAPEVNKEKKIKELNAELVRKELENKILRELLKKTYQVMPIELL